MIQSPVAKGKMCISKLVDKWFLEVVASQWVAKRLYQKKERKRLMIALVNKIKIK